MAKLALLFIAAVCVIQLTSAYRVPRDVESTTNIIDSWNAKLFEGLKTIQKEAEKTFTEDNAKAAWTGIQNGAKAGADKLSELGQGIQKKFDEYTKKD